MFHAAYTGWPLAWKTWKSQGIPKWSGKSRGKWKKLGKSHGKWNQVCCFKLWILQNSFFGRGSAPDPAGGAYDALLNPPVSWGGGHPIPFPQLLQPQMLNWLSGLTLFFINMKQRLLTISVNTRYRVIFACLYWKSQGISCSLESNHPMSVFVTNKCTYIYSAVIIAEPLWEFTRFINTERHQVASDL